MALRMGGGLQATTAVAVSPSNSADIGTNSNGYALYIGTTGDVTVNAIGGGTNITFSSVPVGFFPVLVTRVYSSGTTASNIVAVS